MLRLSTTTHERNKEIFWLDEKPENDPLATRQIATLGPPLRSLMEQKFIRGLSSQWNISTTCELSASCQRNGWQSWAWAGGQCGKLERASLHETDRSINRSMPSPMRFERNLWGAKFGERYMS
ncbi:hypothetical protein MA16_Dca020873 [Dendrobium catenatum]|uniref:Uncharacterized protein n=1 Tax=Dendrobium catenatum TaxID=906689 RepID=A0A2I0WJI1_9ASPA|nr:hypothetical protein MA16_Dca020873 [Dendrobium catenatum]